MLYTNEARELIARQVPWVRDYKPFKKGMMFNYLTFQRLVDEKIIKPVRQKEYGQDVFMESHVLAILKQFPETRPPNRIGIINWIKGERPKNEKRKATR